MSTHRNTFARSLHDLGLATWFGGSLMGAVGVNRAAAAAARTKDTTSVAGAGWSAWTPVNLVAIGAYLVGGIELTLENKGRLVAQRGVTSTAIAKGGLTGVALLATAYSRVIGQRIIAAEDTPADDGTTPIERTSPEVAAAQRQLAVLQWVIPATTGSLIVMSALMGEQQRPSAVVHGVAERFVSHLPSMPHLPSSEQLAPVLEHLPVAPLRRIVND
jgi:hypothetical protein